MTQINPSFPAGKIPSLWDSRALLTYMNITRFEEHMTVGRASPNLGAKCSHSNNKKEFMARTLLGTASPQSGISRLTETAASTSAYLSPAALEARLRQKRSRSYIDAIQQLDAGGHVHGRQEVDALLEAIRRELPEISIEHLPLGLVAKCYLGPPHEVHTLERSGQIIRHYKSSESLPGLLERARSLAQHPGYAFIEVYPDRLIAVAENGETSLVKG